MIFLIGKLRRRSAIDALTGMEEARHPPIGTAPHLDGIEPECKDLLFVETALQTESETGLAYFANARTKFLEAQSFGNGLGNGRQTGPFCGKINAAMFQIARVLNQK